MFEGKIIIPHPARHFFFIQNVTLRNSFVFPFRPNNNNKKQEIQHTSTLTVSRDNNLYCNGIIRKRSWENHATMGMSYDNVADAIECKRGYKADAIGCKRGYKADAIGCKRGYKADAIGCKRGYKADAIAIGCKRGYKADAIGCKRGYKNTRFRSKSQH